MALALRKDREAARAWATIYGRSAGEEKAEQSGWAYGGRAGRLGQQAVNERGREFLLSFLF